MPFIESRLRIVVIAVVALVFTPALIAVQDEPVSKAPTPAESGIPGHHALRDSMSDAFHLT